MLHTFNVYELICLRQQPSQESLCRCPPWYDVKLSLMHFDRIQLKMNTLSVVVLLWKCQTVIGWKWVMSSTTDTQTTYWVL